MSDQQNNAVAKKENAEQTFRTALSVATESYMSVIKKQMLDGGAVFDEYAGKCVLAAMGAINSMMHNQGLTLNDLYSSNLNEILIKVATMRLNANAVPRECYFQIRNVNVAAKGDPANYEKQIEFGIEGDGNDAILANFGRDIKKVYQVWKVRSGDKFVYPKHNGLEMTAPQWEPTGQGEVIRVVYPIVKTDGTVEYYIGERRDVIKNLYAHISNNMMNETFGIITGKKSNGKDRTRYDATEDEKKQIDAEKKKIMDKAKSLGDIDAILDCEELSQFISPAWKEPQSREEMIIRKMRNNVVKKIPKDFGSAIAAEQYNLMDDTYREIHAEIEDNANSVVYESPYQEVKEEEPAPQEPKQIESTPEPEQVTEPEPEPTEAPQEQAEEKPKKAESKQKKSAKETEPSEQMEMPEWMQ